VTEKWNIPLTKIHAIVTDNGSNMIKAFCTRHEDDNVDEDSDCFVFDNNSNDHEDKDVDDDRTLLDEEIEYDEKETEYEEAFDDFGKRVSCFAYTLQLVVHKFVKKLLACAFAVVKK